MRLLGEILQEEFGVAAESIEAALAVQREKGGRIGEILIQLRKISESDLLNARSIQCGLEVVHALPDDFEPFFVPRVPIGFLKKFKMVPIATPAESYIAVAEPFFFQQLDDLQRHLDWEGIKTVLAPQNEVFVAINSAYDMTRQDVADQVMQDMDEDNPESILSEIEETSDLLDDTSDAPVIKR